MTSRVLALLVSAAVLVATAPLRAGQDSGEPQFRVRIEASNLDSLRESLERAGYDVLGTDPANSTIEVVVSRDELYGLQSSGLSIVSIERGHPLQAAPPRKTKASGQEFLATAAAVSAGYLTLDGINARLSQIAEAYPAIAQVVDVTATYNAPPTFEGRHIYALKISDNVAVDEDEPAMLIATTHHAREISTPVIAPRSRRSADSRIRHRPPHHRRGQRSRDLDRPGLESRRLQPRLHDRQSVEEEPPRLHGRRGRRSEPQLRAGLGDLVRRQHERQVRDLQRALASLGSRDPDDDGVVRDRAIRQGHRLPLLRTGSPLRVPMPGPPVHGLDAAGSRGALGGVRIRRPHASAKRRGRASAVAIRASLAPTRSSSRRTRSSSRRTPAR